MFRTLCALHCWSSIVSRVKGLPFRVLALEFWVKGFGLRRGSSERLGRFGVCSRENACEKDGCKFAATEDRHGSWNAQAQKNQPTLKALNLRHKP